jgi:hypothetical protein
MVPKSSADDILHAGGEGAGDTVPTIKVHHNAFTV